MQILRSKNYMFIINCTHFSIGEIKMPTKNSIKLTKTEIEILKLVALGYNNKRIGTELFMSPHTVKSHLAKIQRQLNATDRTNAVYIATKVYRII